MPFQSVLLLPISLLIPLLAPSPLLATNEFAFCRQLPHSNYLSAQDFIRVCQHRSQWILDREQPANEEGKTESQRKYLEWLEGTRNGPGGSKKAKGGQTQRLRRQQELLPLKGDNGPKEHPKGRRKFIRKEYRAMGDLERKQLQKALNGLKQRRIDNVTIWDLHILVHYPHSAPAAHWGPAFLPWHREFLRQFEAALQNEVPDLVGLPYWDSTLDHGLPDPADSVLWADELMGNGNGFVRTGPFRDWDTNVLMPLSPVPIKRLFRSTGGRSQDRLMSPSDVDWILGRSNFSELTFCHDKTFESMHGLSHVWVGGFMFVIRVSPNDPTFYFHHAFMDFLWEQFRQRRQNRWQRENEYAEKTCNGQHEFGAQMKPFKLQNRDGLSNDYTDFWFEYEPIRHCGPQMPFCDSKFLFCDKLAWRCRSRIQLGGNCTGFGGTEICYESICIQNVCRVPATEGNGFQRQERQHEGVVWAKSLMLSEESRPLTSGIGHVNVGQNRTAFLERNGQYPETNGLVYLPLPNPKDPNAEFTVNLEALDHYGRYCQSYCLNGTTDKYQICEPKLVLRSRLGPIGGPNGPSASNISFTHQIAARKFLDMDLSVHPKVWKVFSPFIVFNCQRKLLNSALVREITDQLSAPLGQLSSPFVWFRVGLLKKPGSPVDLDDLQIEAEDVGAGGQRELFLSSVRRARSPFDQSVLILRARNPFLHPAEGGITVRVSIRQAGIKVDCDVRCNSEQGSSPGDDCQPQVRLHSNPDLSQEQAFSPESSYLPYLGWRMIEENTNLTLNILLNNRLMNANRVSLNGLAAFGMSPINEEGSRSNLFDFSDLTKSNLPQPEFDEKQETPDEMISAPAPVQQMRPPVPIGQIIRLDRNIEQTMMEMNTFHEQEEVEDAVAVVLDNEAEDLNNEALRKRLENQEMAIDLLKRELAAAEKKLAMANSHIDNFEELEVKMLLENFQLKKELLKLKVKFRMISVDEAAKELGCGSAEFVEEQNQ